MQYIEQFFQLKELFDPFKDEVVLPDSSLVIRNFDFTSTIPAGLTGDTGDESIDQNIHFRYPVFFNCKQKYSNQVIILLHGLNERSWHKHLTGAKYLAEKSGKSVILFPLSFHINRGLPEWTDLRQMVVPLENRKKMYPHIKDATLVNFALSDRLTGHPERFFMSGLQSSLDLITLMKQIKDGQHPLFEKNASVDLFAYSISCMLLQSMMISNPENLFSNSRIVLFAGGSLFSHIQGMSRYIMDSIAFDALKCFYNKITSGKTRFLHELEPWIMEHKLGKSFRSLVSPGMNKNLREKVIDGFAENLMVIALRKDRVMPLDGIRQATGDKFYRSGHFKILDFPYEYSHENPFPVLNKNQEKNVDAAFLSVFKPSVSFYAK